MNTSAPVAFTADELWLLQKMVRHELPQQDTWKFPPASIELNDQIAEAIVACVDMEMREATLTLTRGDLLVIDYLVPNDAKSALGLMMGREILLKTFRARRVLDGTELPGAAEPVDSPTLNEVDALLAQWEYKPARKSRKRP